MKQKNINNMNNLIIVAHPNQKSFCFSGIAATIQSELEKNNEPVYFLDLYRDNLSLSFSEDKVKKYKELVIWADRIYFISPVWWFRCTPLLEAFFDYVYADTITEAQYKKSEYSSNFYVGQFSNDILDMSFGDFIYNSNSNEDELTKKASSVDEFGSTVREIYRLNTKFDERPAKPIDISLSLNKSAKILGSKIS